jgi:antirestriction protein ArdC
MHDIYQSVTDRIVAALDHGAPPWVRPWSVVSETVPTNVQTRRPYRGINFALLSLQASARGYEVNRWLTYRQALELGGQVRKGEHGTPVVFWKLRKVAATAETFPDTNPPDLPDRVYPLLRAYTVFNVAQVDGLDAQSSTTKTVEWPPEARAEELLLMSGATVCHGGSKAFYRPDSDEIQLPPRSAFPTAAGYYNVALHELTHWTGHQTRCARDFSYRFRAAAYAAEELVAEMGAAFLCAHCRIDGELRHASYLTSWLQMLRSDKQAMFIAAAKAQRAADYVLNLADPTRAFAKAA